MPAFEYTASDKTGAISKGTLEASDKGAASRALGSQGLFVLEIKPAAAGESAPPTPSSETPPVKPDPRPNYSRRSSPRPPERPRPAPVAKPEPRTEADGTSKSRWPFRPGWSPLHRAIYLRQLYVMFEAGIPIHSATAQLHDNEEYHSEVRRRLAEVPRDLQRGRLLSKSLERSGLFPNLILSSIKVGEESGRLGQILRNLSDGEERAVKLRRTLVSRLTYPIVVLLVMSLGLVVMGHVMSRVMLSLPGFKPESIPLLGLVTSVYQSPYFLPLCFLLASGLGALVWKTVHTPVWRLAAERFLFRVPVMGNLLIRLETNSVTSQLSLLLQAGIPLDRGLELCAEIVATETFRRSLRLAKEAIRSGSDVSEAFSVVGLFPDDVMALVAAGEMVGRLDQSLDKASEYCADQVERTLETALALIEPLLIGFLGVAIGTVLLCTFVPIFNSLQTL